MILAFSTVQYSAYFPVEAAAIVESSSGLKYGRRCVRGKKGRKGSAYRLKLRRRLSDSVKRLSTVAQKD